MSDGEWADYGPGVKVRRLGGEGGAGFYLLRMEPGARVQRHSHPQQEVDVVLEGAVEVAVHPWPPIVHTLEVGDSLAVCADEEHEVQAHPDLGAELLTVARPDWGPPS